MPPFVRVLACVALVVTWLTNSSNAQQLPGSVQMTMSGAFINGEAESNHSVLFYDNDLTDGYGSGFDLHDAPELLATGGPAGSAAFQWGEIPNRSDYSHTSALWFAPLAIGPIGAEESFAIGNLFYRNGTIVQNTGASSVDLALTMSFAAPDGIDPMALTFHSSLINTTNNSNPYSSADIVTLDNSYAPLGFTDASGNAYFFELSFQVDSDTMDGTLSTVDQFHVFEGGQGGAVLLGRITTNPFGLTGVPEPSSLVLALGGALLGLRRRR